MVGKKSFTVTAGILCFAIPFTLYFVTRSDSLGFADAGEFALVTKIAGIAHPPGFPAYVTTGWLWSKLFSVFSGSHIELMILFSIFCTSLSSVFLFLTLNKILSYIIFSEGNDPFSSALTSAVSAVAFCTGITVWHWANNVEVYALHILALSVLIYGLVSFQFKKRNTYLVLAGAGLATGLANHHLTMIFFLPFIPMFFRDNFFASKPTQKKSKSKSIPNTLGYFGILRSKSFQLMMVATAIFVIAFYSWMVVRAGQEVAFKFGNPDNFSRLYYHLAGGAWQKNTAAEVEGITAMRFPYFMNLTFTQLFLFIPFVLWGFVELFRKKMYQLMAAALLYYLIILIYQLRIDQTADTDAYMLLPFFVLSIPAAIGIFVSIKKIRWIVFLLPVLLLAQITLNFPASDKRKFNLSESLMDVLDKSAPGKSVILISDWTLVSQYYYYRLAEKFRTDLVVLNYDLKFTNWKILPLVYPDFYRAIKKEYDEFIRVLGENHPQEIYNTGCTLNTPQLMNSYLGTVSRIKKICADSGFAFMCDPKAFLFLQENKIMTGNSYMSGFFVSAKQTGSGTEFLKLPFDWLESPLLLNEPAAVDKLVDFEAALDFSRNYFRQINDTLNFNLAENSYQKIKTLQKKMKKNMPFVYRAKGQ